MDNEEVYISHISRYYFIAEERVRQLRRISLDEAVRKFLSVEDFEDLHQKGLYASPEERKGQYGDSYLSASTLIPKSPLKEYFDKTPEGKEWYLSKYPQGAVLDSINKTLLSRLDIGKKPKKKLKSFC